MSDHTLFAQIKDEAARPDPYPLFARLRECPVSRQEDGTYVAASHAAIASLLHDPRVSSETLPPADRPKTGNPLKDWLVKPVRDHITDTHRPFIFRDPPDHDDLRAAVMQQFTPQRVQALRARSHILVDEILDKLGDATAIDIVDDLAYPLPVTVICELLGIPPADEAQ
ncbi:MAG: cytochrome P450, partial [Methylobacterium sp.]